VSEKMKINLPKFLKTQQDTSERLTRPRPLAAVPAVLSSFIAAFVKKTKTIRSQLMARTLVIGMCTIKKEDLQLGALCQCTRVKMEVF
jgi:hypothetical protein